MRAALVLVALLLAPPAGGTAQAQSPLAAEMRAFASRYHEDPPRLDALYAGLWEAVKTDSHLDNFLALAQAAFIWGDIRARTAEDKLAAYERGRQAGQRAVELAPRNALAHLWLAINAGRWGQTKGVLRSLFLLPTVREHMDAALELDPKLLPAYTLAGLVYAEVPGLFGGDLEKSEALFRKALALDARWTSARVGLARTLLKRGRGDDARRELEAVAAEREPRNLADWTMKDSREARELLATLGTAR
ncbi:MAG TPA: tetratricopeptide repeat protein [Candidatus Nitrosocosmicus sp.]|nr:tetratricopeptide repeat protein [Candidatus Nitrosocosmicus sp.]